jgi:hypothetical protein
MGAGDQDQAARIVRAIELAVQRAVGSMQDDCGSSGEANRNAVGAEARPSRPSTLPKRPAMAVWQCGQWPSGRQVVAADVVPVANDQRGRQLGQKVVPPSLMHVAGENVVQAGIERDAPGLAEGGGGVGGCRHLPVGMEGREMQRHVRPQFLATQVASSLISAGLSFWPGMSRVVISSQQSVSWCM